MSQPELCAGIRRHLVPDVTHNAFCARSNWSDLFAWTGSASGADDSLSAECLSCHGAEPISGAAPDSAEGTVSCRACVERSSQWRISLMLNQGVFPSMNSLCLPAQQACRQHSARPMTRNHTRNRGTKENAQHGTTHKGNHAARDEQASRCEKGF